MMTDPDSLTKWRDIDDLIVAELMIHAIKLYREWQGVGINQAIEALNARQQELRLKSPERF